MTSALKLLLSGSDRQPLPEILQFARQQETKHSALRPHHSTYFDGLQRGDNLAYLLRHATPLMALRGRDLDALTEFFHREDMIQIYDNIENCLDQLWPALDWEEDFSGYWHESGWAEDLNSISLNLTA
jgi:hypothetical protein